MLGQLYSKADKLDRKYCNLAIILRHPVCNFDAWINDNYRFSEQETTQASTKEDVEASAATSKEDVETSAATLKEASKTTTAAAPAKEASETTSASTKEADTTTAAVNTNEADETTSATSKINSTFSSDEEETNESSKDAKEEGNCKPKHITQLSTYQLLMTPVFIELKKMFSNHLKQKMTSIE